MKTNIKKTIKKYSDIEQTYSNAFVGIPKEAIGAKNDFLGSWADFLQSYPNFNPVKKLPVLLFMYGSAGLSKNKIFQSLIPEKTPFIFFAPDSFRINNRPTYKSPVSHKAYNKVHEIRQAEIYISLKKLIKFDFIDRRNIFLMGHSEGALSAAIYKSKNIKGRIISGFSCEDSYFYKNPKLGSAPDEPFLNIIGTDDQYFGRCSEFNKFYNTAGHGGIALQNNKNAKIVLLGNTPHDVTQSIYTVNEIVSFLNFWVGK